ncbi:biotin/lipoyl-binding protein [bacterium]|nr:biotin/lipoyl-binding protein [bacterium]
MIFRDGNDAAHDVRVELDGNGRARVTRGESETEYAVESLGGGCFRIAGERGSRRVWVDRDGSVRHVTVEGVGQARMEKEGKGRRRRREAPEGTHASMMPGTVVKVLVAEGDAVTKGDTLVIVEAMKMEIKLSAQLTGTVRAVRAKEGAACDAGETLVELDASEGAEAAEAAS